MSLRRGQGVATGRAWAVLLAAANTSGEGPKRPSARVLHGLGALAKPGAKRQTLEGVAGWPDFEPDFAEEPGLIQPYLSATLGCPLSLRKRVRVAGKWLTARNLTYASGPGGGAFHRVQCFEGRVRDAVECLARVRCRVSGRGNGRTCSRDRGSAQERSGVFSGAASAWPRLYPWPVQAGRPGCSMAAE